MTTHDFDGPRMIYTGELPPHLLRAASAGEDDTFGSAEGVEGRRPTAAVLGAAAIALIAGIGIGAVMASQLTPKAPVAVASRGGESKMVPPAAQANAPVAEPAPTETADASPAPVLTPVPARAEAPPPATILENRLGSAPRAALAMLLPAPKGERVAAAAPARTAPPPCAGRSRAEATVCADPVVAAADRDLRAAYQQAATAGAPAEAIRADQIDWMLAREEAARRSPAELALAYRQRIDRVNSLAAESPH